MVKEDIAKGRGRGRPGTVGLVKPLNYCLNVIMQTATLECT